METRLLPISTVFGRFPRMVRDTAEAEGKRVRLVQAGGETPLDKAVLDRLERAAACTCVTNAIVHGIESPRTSAAGPGSPRRAPCGWRPSPQAGRVVIRVSRRRPRARREGDPEEGRGAGSGRAQRREHPAPQPDLPAGLSTAERVSTLAGRGVGLDVVAGAIHALGGTIDVETAVGQGTAFTLSLPVTLAIVRSLIVEIDQERYALPLAHVAETVRAEPRGDPPDQPARRGASGAAT